MTAKFDKNVLYLPAVYRERMTEAAAELHFTSYLRRGGELALGLETGGRAASAALIKAIDFYFHHSIG